MKFRDPEALYRTFIRHTLECGVCGPAGGEAAAPSDLCETGRALLNAWGQAETAYAQVEQRIQEVG